MPASIFVWAGDNVNLTSRLQGLNKAYGTSIIISRAMEHCVRDEFLVRSLDLVAVKGKSKAVEVFELVNTHKDATDDERRRVMQFNAACSLYRSRQFELAASAFTAVLQATPGDKAAARHVEACRMYIADPPPADWDGVVRMHEK